MYITINTIIEIGKVIGALGVIGGVVLAIYKVFKAPKEQADEINAVRELHKSDMKELKAELCVMNYALLATLDGLKQLHCNGNVTKAYDRLEKHLNKQAHDQT